jgi:ribosome biogenesis protein SSF1/2
MSPNNILLTHPYPQLVLASFPAPSPTTPPHLPLLMKALQSLFPPLSPKNLSLSSARRVVLVSYNPTSGTLDFRHYLITVRPYGVSRRVRRIIEATTAGGASKQKTLDLSNHQDVADFLLRKNPAGYESASSAASSAGEEDSDNAVALPTDYVGRNNKKGDRRAVRLDEIGPRMELKLVKIVEGVPGKEGSVIYHQFGEFLQLVFCVCCVLIFCDAVTKTKAEIVKQQAEHAAKEKLRKQRRDEQERNVKRKKMSQEKDRQGEEAEEEADEEKEEEEHDDEGAWDDEEEISEGEGEDEDGEGESSESEAEQQRIPPSKRRKR